MIRCKCVALLCIAASMVAAGCSDKPNNAAIEAQRQSHSAKLQAELNKPVEPRVYQFGRNELVMLEIPIASGMDMAQRQRCFIWRDMDMQTSSLSCSNPPEMILP